MRERQQKFYTLKDHSGVTMTFSAAKKLLMALVLSLNAFVQFGVVLGKSYSVEAAFAPFGQPAVMSFQKRAKADMPVEVNRAHNIHVLGETSKGDNLNRRNFFSSMASLPVIMVANRATADNSTEVDWASFGASLQQPGQFKSPAPSNAGGSDLQKALEDSAKRKAIDPRTHG